MTLHIVFEGNTGTLVGAHRKGTGTETFGVREGLLAEGTSKLRRNPQDPARGGGEEKHIPYVMDNVCRGPAARGEQDWAGWG